MIKDPTDDHQLIKNPFIEICLLPGSQ